MFVKTLSLFGAFIVAGAVSLSNALGNASDLEVVGKSSVAEYLVSKSSINLDPEELTVEFEFYTRFFTPLNERNKTVKTIVERSLILCRTGSFIVTEQLWFDDKDQPVGGARSSKHYSPKPGTVQRAIVEYVCGAPNQKRDQKKERLSDQTA